MIGTLVSLKHFVSERESDLCVIVTKKWISALDFDSDFVCLLGIKFMRMRSSQILVKLKRIFSKLLGLTFHTIEPSCFSANRSRDTIVSC